MEIIRVTRPSENKIPSKLKSRIPLGRAVVALGLALPAVVLLPGCVPVEMIPTPDFWAKQTEHKPIRVVSENLNTIPQSTRQAIETKSKSSITEALIFDVSQGNPDGYVIDKTQNNASGISFDLYTLSNGKMVGAFPSEDGTVNMTEVIGVDEITSDGSVYRTLKTIVNNNGQDEEHVFIALGYGQVKTANNISSLDGTKQQALVQSQIEKNQIESIIFGNPYLPSPNAIVLIEDKNFQGQKDVTFTDSLKNIGYQVKFVSFQQDILSTNTPKSSTGTLVPSSQTPEPPLPTETPQVVFTPTETPTPTPAIVDVKIKDAIGEQEFHELNTSIGSNREISGTDYATGQIFEGTIKTETATAKLTADWHFKNIVNAEAQDKEGNIFKVVWNPDTNTWVKVTEIYNNLADMKTVWVSNFTHFNNIDKMVSAGDLDLILLSQGNGAEPFPDTTVTPHYWINVNRTRAYVNGKNGKIINDYFLYLANVQGSGGEISQRKDLFNKKNKPYDYQAVITGTNKDGKELYLFTKKILNLDRTNIFEYIGLDPLKFQILQDPSQYKDPAKDPNGLIGRMLIDDAYNIVPVFPLPPDVAPWDNISTISGYGNGQTYDILFRGGDLLNNVTVGMQVPGEVFDRLPAYIQKGIIEKMTEARKGEDVGSKPSSVGAFQLIGGISPELAELFSRRIFVAGFHYGPQLP